MKKAESFWTGHALDDLLLARTYSQRQDRAAGKALWERLRQAAEGLQDFPQLGRRVPEFQESQLREVPVPPLRLIYRYEAKTRQVMIVRIWHSRKNLEGEGFEA